MDKLQGNEREVVDTVDVGHDMIVLVITKTSSGDRMIADVKRRIRNEGLLKAST